MEWNLITCMIVPVISQPPVFPGDGRTDGIGPSLFTAFVSPAVSHRSIWGAGPVVQAPTNSNDRLGNDRWGLGPYMGETGMQAQVRDGAAGTVIGECADTEIGRKYAADFSKSAPDAANTWVSGYLDLMVFSRSNRSRAGTTRGMRSTSGRQRSRSDLASCAGSSPWS